MNIEVELARNLLQLNFGHKVTHIYNPIEHARQPHMQFLEKYCNKQKILFLGMNPGPFGMAQTGVPFGEVTMVRDWLKIQGDVTKPANEHPKRPILGFNCTRKEVSGSRFWGFFQEKCKDASTFFRNCFVYNHSPLVFMSQSGKNLTPPDLPKEARNQMNSLCDAALCEIIKLMNVQTVICVGKFAQVRTLAAFKGHDIQGVKVHVISHPSPANPAANKGWFQLVEKELNAMGVINDICAQ